jgi:hypothetical protein
VKKP